MGDVGVAGFSVISAAQVLAYDHYVYTGESPLFHFPKMLLCDYMVFSVLLHTFKDVEQKLGQDISPWITYNQFGHFAL